MRHTPGPWNAVRSATCGHLRAAHNHRKDPREEWTDADLALINAAPELLAALEDALSGWSYIRCVHGDLPGVGWERVANAARAAIVKARGGAA